MAPQLRDLQLAPRDPPTFAVGLVCLALLGVAGWYMLGAGGTDGRLTHMHCSECLEEFRYDARSAHKPCALCKGSSVLVPTIGSRADGGDATSDSGRLVVFVVLFAIIGQGFVYGAILRGRRLREREAMRLAQPIVVRCPFCQRKAAVSVGRVGTPLVCRRCETAFVVPRADETA